MKSKIKSLAGILKAVTLILAALLLTEAGLKAQPAQLTLKEAINQALQANQDVRKARLDQENSKYKVDEVRGTALPQISGNGSLTYNPILQLSALPGDLAGQPGQTILVAFGQKWNAGAGVQLNQSLFDKSIFTGLKAAKTTEEFYKLNTQLSEEQIIEMVANSYYQLQVQKQRLYVLDSNYNSTSRVRKVLQGQYENGLSRKIDVDRISVSISNIEAQRQQLRNTIKQAENQVKFLIGFPIQSAINIPDVVLKDIHPEATDQTDSLLLDERTEVMVLKKQTELLAYQKKSIEAQYYPTLGLAGNYNYQGLGNDFPIFKGASRGVNWFDFASVGLNLKIPIFKGGSTKAKIRQADVEIRKAKEDLDKTSLSLNMEFENAKSQLNSSIIILNNQKENADLAREVFDNTQNNYNNGLATLTDLLDSESSLTEAQNNYSTALLDYKIAEIQLLKAKGKLKTLIN